jgi:hypothetical protein
VPKLILRFVGRFAFATETGDDGTPQRISVLAPRFTDPFQPHEALMTIRRNKVALDPKLTDLAPAHKVVGDSPRAVDADLYVWPLASTLVRFERRTSAAADADAPPRLAFEKPERIVFTMGDLLDKGQAGTGAIDPAALRPTADGKTQTVIEIDRGIGLAKMVSQDDSSTLVTRKDAQDKNPEDLVIGLNDGKGNTLPFPLADVVEFEERLATREPFTIVLINVETGKQGRVSVVGMDPEAVIIVSFSNRCADLPANEVPYDFEFAQYYTLLQAVPSDDRMLIPKHQSDGGEIEDCDTLVQINFRRTSGAVVQ